jgi:hypothetical protein
LRFAGVAKELFGYDPHTTNNRMEPMAPIQGLLALKEPCEVDITTDSEYVRQGITKWIVHWKRGLWWKKNRPVRNADLWIEFDGLAGIHRTISLHEAVNAILADGAADGFAGSPLEVVVTRHPAPAELRSLMEELAYRLAGGDLAGLIGAICASVLEYEPSPVTLSAMGAGGRAA